MTDILKVATCICLMLILIEISQAQGWRGIVPLRSSRSDVEKLLGAGRGSVAFYGLKDKNILITYSDGLDCDEKGADEWNVPKDKVIHIAVTFLPKARVTPNDLKLDLRKFGKTRRGTQVTYSSDELGLQLTIEGGLVQTLLSFPAKKDSHMMCPLKGASNNPFSRSAAVPFYHCCVAPR
jgi:hypothetical protein